MSKISWRFLKSGKKSLQFSFEELEGFHLGQVILRQSCWEGCVIRRLQDGRYDRSSGCSYDNTFCDPKWIRSRPHHLLCLGIVWMFNRCRESRHCKKTLTPAPPSGCSAVSSSIGIQPLQQLPLPWRKIEFHLPPSTEYTSWASAIPLLFVIKAQNGMLESVSGLTLSWKHLWIMRIGLSAGICLVTQWMDPPDASNDRISMQ